MNSFIFNKFWSNALITIFSTLFFLSVLSCGSDEDNGVAPTYIDRAEVWGLWSYKLTAPLVSSYAANFIGINQTNLLELTNKLSGLREVLTIDDSEFGVSWHYSNSVHAISNSIKVYEIESVDNNKNYLVAKNGSSYMFFAWKDSSGSDTNTQQVVLFREITSNNVNSLKNQSLTTTQYFVINEGESSESSPGVEFEALLLTYKPKVTP